MKLAIRGAEVGKGYIEGLQNRPGEGRNREMLKKRGKNNKTGNQALGEGVLGARDTEGTN